MKTKILITGGTIDKEYNPLTGELEFTQSIIPHVVSEFAANQYESETLFLIDSLAMQEPHRQLILKACQNTPHEKIVITHGTDTMVQTAKAIAKANLTKTIVLTGAMIPLRIANSEGKQNIAFALGVSQNLPIGVYISMNGRVFSADNCQKDTSLGLFKTLFE